MRSKRRRLHVRELSIEEIEEIASQFKEDLTRRTEQLVRQDEARDAYATVLAKEYIDKFVYDLKYRAGSGLKEYLSRPPRARPIHINKALRSK